MPISGWGANEFIKSPPAGLVTTTTSTAGIQPDVSDRIAAGGFKILIENENTGAYARDFTQNQYEFLMRAIIARARRADLNLYLMEWYAHWLNG